MLLITTPRQLLLFDPEQGTTERLREGDGEYFGVSWDRHGPVLSHSNQDNEALRSIEDYRAAPKGTLTFHRLDSAPTTSPRTLIQPHQIECIDDLVLASNTGQNCLTVFGADGAFQRHVRLNDVLWDRLEDGTTGNHFNSVHRHGERVYVVAHNHERHSAVHELTWPALEPVRVHESRARWAHNVWLGEHGMVMCDSKDGSLLAVEQGRPLWRPNEANVITRGLAVTPEYIYVGRSNYGTRGERVRNDGGLWMVERKTLRTVASFLFRGSGCVNDVRVLNAPDECHVSTPFDMRWLALLRCRGAVVAESPASR
jgi:hypothetical protein